MSRPNRHLDEHSDLYRGETPFVASGRYVAGPVLFARYAYPPNALGYCGPADPAALLEMTSDGRDLSGLGHLAARFEGAWPYLQLIASCNHITDPLDSRVVEAYWTGNELLARVPSTALAASLGDRFEQRAGRRFGPLVSGVQGAIAQHSFHVFAVYPWLGLLRAGMEGAPLKSSIGAAYGGEPSKRWTGTWSPSAAGPSVSKAHVLSSAPSRSSWLDAESTDSDLPTSFDPVTWSPCIGIGCVTGSLRPRVTGSDTARCGTWLR